MASSFGEDDVTIRFVIPSSKKTEDLCTDSVKQAFQVCIDHNLIPTWVSEEDCLGLEPVKTDIFVFEEFTGQAFGFLKSCQCLIVGPRCILDCVAANILIPKGDNPLYTVAMRNLIITSTGFTEPLKSQIIEKIKYMGGLYCPEYRQSVTHLVAYQIGSAKYEKALETELPVMSEHWVEAVWEESCKRNVCATDEEFLRFRCPVFHRMVVTCSQLPRSLKEKLRHLINSNGGEFSGELEAERTKVLVIAKPFGEKYKHALLWRIPCAVPAWVTASVARGHALPTAAFAPAPPPPPEGRQPATSTPQRPTAPAQDLNFSSSMIQPSIKNIDETLNCTSMSVASIKQIESPKEAKHLMLIKKLNLLEVKKAGSFLDGCNVYLSGFNAEISEKLRKIINSGGATRFNEISDSVTHVIYGDIATSDLNMLKNQGATRLHVVSVQWLLESLRLRRPAPEAAFSCLQDLALDGENTSSPQRLPLPLASPLSKKGLLQLKAEEAVAAAAATPCGRGKGGGAEEVRRALDLGSPSTPVANSQLDDSPQRSLLQLYSQQEGDTTHFQERVGEAADSSSPPAAVTDSPAVSRIQPPTPSAHVSNTLVTSAAGDAVKQKDYFKGLTFSIAGYGAVNSKELTSLINTGGGRVVTRRFKGVVDYSVVPLQGADVFHSAEEVVTHLWLEDCSEECRLVPLQYYHRPLALPLDVRPLEDCVVTATLYSGAELRFISEVLQGLGAVHQAMMARVDRPGDGIRATTHLVAPERPHDLLASRKYKAACKWGVPCVTERWALGCAAAGRRLPHEDFLVSAHDLDVSVVDKTPLAHPTKRKLGEDTHISKLDLPGASPRTPAAEPSPSRLGDSMRPPATPDDPAAAWATPRGPRDIPTPDTPYGQVFVDNPSPRTRKMWKRWIDEWPEEPSKQPPRLPKRRNSTPVAELKRRIWQKFAIEPYEKSFGVKVAADSEPRDEVGVGEAEAEAEAVEDPDSPLSLPTTAHLKDTCTGNITDAHTENLTNNFKDSTSNRPSPAAVLPVSQSSMSAGAANGTSWSPQCQSPQAATPEPAQQGINTQLRELGQLMDSVCRSGGGSGSGGALQTAADGGGRQQPPATQHDGAMLGSELVEWVDPVVSNRQQTKTLVFMLTSIEARDKYEAAVRALGGVMSTLPAPDASVSHLVCEAATRNEKILSSIAAGKWLLDKRFLTDSLRAGRFLDEEDYEWGNPRARYLEGAHAEGSVGAQLAAAAFRWRRRVQATGRGAFHGMRAIVGAGADKSALYSRLIIAGGGTVIPVRPPFSDPEDATICILELNKVTFPVDLKSLAAKGVPCVFPIYLNNFLISDPPPDVKDCLIPQYKQLLDVQ